ETAMDRFKPSVLLAGVQADVDSLRTQIVHQIALDSWSQALDDVLARANELLEQADPARLTPIVEHAIGDLIAAVSGPKRRGASASFGGIIATLLGGTGLRVSSASFERVVDWIGGESGCAALNGRVAAIAASIAKTRDAVASFDLDAESPR